MLSCVLFLYFSIYITNCNVLVFSKFNTWLRVRGTAIRLAIAPEFFLLFLYSRILCLLWLAEIKYVYDDVYVKCADTLISYYTAVFQLIRFWCEVTDWQDWMCKTLTAVVYYSLIANTAWMFVEALYLHARLTVSVFQKTDPFVVYCFIGWGNLAVIHSQAALSIIIVVKQEAPLSPRDRAMRLVSSNLANYHATVQKILIRQVLTKPMVLSWRFTWRQCVINKPTTVELCISSAYRRLDVAKFSKSTM